MAMDLKDTLNLPQTDFPMRGDLIKREPLRLQHWGKQSVYSAVLEKNAAGPSFILHDGPPFTNGDLHLGHALNKTLKDTILRYKWMRGYNAPYVPGWDSHGLPIEHKVTRELQEQGKRDYTVGEVRKASAAFAAKFRAIQTEQFKRLGVLGDWDKPYWTIDADYEAKELETFAAFVRKGLVYRSKKPVYWSIPCRTALAEAEIEYRDHRSPSIYVRFPLTPAAAEKLGLEGAGIVIWTTTPWTLPANLAVAMHPELDYVALASDKGVHIVAASLAESFCQACDLQNVSERARFKGSDLAGLIARHPFIERESRIITADYVTTDTGTGCVHIAPGHGLEDYHSGLENGLEVYCPLDDDGCYVDDGRIPTRLVGISVLEEAGKSPANKAVLEMLDESGNLLKLSFFNHSYPHCWRSKTPVIFRAMDQWFVALDKGEARATALKALDDVNFIPEWGEKRIRAAIENRPDWCISRQRSWGVPIPAFYDADGNAFLDADVICALAEKIAEHGTDWWFANSATTLLEGITLPQGWPTAEHLQPGTDTLDVWIDSGCSHRAVLQNNPQLSWPADLYLEGSDQHRGWFQSSLWTSVVADGKAPYQTLLTHGFIVKEDGTKLSKSDGAARPLTEWIAKYGADIVRLWICSQDYRGDVPVSDKIVANVANAYRSIRNTLRFQLGNLHDFDFERDAVAVADLHPLDQWALHETNVLIRSVTEAFERYEFHRAYHELMRFCTNTLSATYHDILKDRLYTRSQNDPLRRSSQTAIHHIFSSFVRLLAPLLPFTADEAWSHAHANQDHADSCIALADWPVADPAWDNHKVAEDIRALRTFLSEQVNDPLEELRKAKQIGQSLDAAVILTGAPGDEQFERLLRYSSDLEELFIVSQVELHSDNTASTIRVETRHADGVRCPRSWRWVPALVETDTWGAVSPRCAEALKARG